MYDDDEPLVWGSGDPALWALRARDRGEVEFADRRTGDFPASWGEPPGTRWSEQRAAWVAEHVAAHVVEKRRTRGGSARAALALARVLELS